LFLKAKLKIAEMGEIIITYENKVGESVIRWTKFAI